MRIIFGILQERREEIAVQLVVMSDIGSAGVAGAWHLPCRPLVQKYYKSGKRERRGNLQDNRL